jgi:hypothetical protein
MKKNVGSVDRIIRLLLAALFILLFVFKSVTGIFGYILLVFAFIFIVTSLVNFCPLYAIFGIKTCKK